MTGLASFRDDAAAWLAAHTRDAPPDYGAIIPEHLDAEGRAWQRLLHDEGWAGLHWPTELGGRGLTAEHQAVWLEEAARAGVPPFINMVSIVLMGGTVLAHGTPEQQAEHLGPTLRGERLWCQLFSEPEAGSDLAGLATRAEPDGDSWRITGQKTWCSNGRIADWGILLARTEPDVPKHRGISFFLLDMRLPGIELRPIRQMTGGSEFDEVFLDDVVVPASCIVGPLHGGWGVAMSTLTNERGHIGASVIALGNRLDDLLAQTAGGDDVVRLVAQIRALQQLGLRQGPAASVAASLLKLGITEVGFAMSEAAVDAAGADALLASDVTNSLLAAPGGRIAGGTSQVQRNIIGELILGLPKEPRPEPRQ